MSAKIEKSCDNCYYKLSEITQNKIRDLQKYDKNISLNLCALDVKDKSVCQHWSLGCSHCGDEYGEFLNEATFKYKGKFYCEECCAKEVGIEIQPYKAYLFYDADGEYLGDSHNIELQDVLLNCSVVEYIGNDD